MPTKLKAVIVDDDPISIAMLKDYCEDSGMVEVVACYNDPRNFLNNANRLKFELCLLDIMMPEMEGTAVAQILKDKPVIFVTGVYEKLKEALALSPIDIVTKPLYKVRFDKAIAKAYALLATKEKYKVFNVAESVDKIKLCLSDILLLLTDESDSRHKQVFMRDGEMHTLMDYSLEEILENCPSLLQVNKSAAASLEVIGEVKHDNLRLTGIKSPEAPCAIYLGRAFRKELMAKLAYL
jgi:DNA-binding LytR/AlgR family response regulator